MYLPLHNVIINKTKIEIQEVSYMSRPLLWERKILLNKRQYNSLNLCPETDHPWTNKHLLAECEIRTASYGLSFFPSFYGLSAKRASHANKEGKRGSITCRTDRANEASKMFSIWLCWLFRESNKIIWRFDRWSRARGPYGYWRTWKWPIPACEINLSYNNYCYCSIYNQWNISFLE